MDVSRVLAISLMFGCGSDGAAGSEGPTGAMGDKGDKGDTGDVGADGQLRIYGNGSAGALTISVGASLFQGVAADGNLQFTDFTINVGVTLFVPSGTVIRCSGTFTNNGTVVVEKGALGGRTRGPSATVGTMPGFVPAHLGASRAAAMSGATGDASQVRLGGSSGLGHGMSGRVLLNPGLFGGGGAAEA